MCVYVRVHVLCMCVGVWLLKRWWEEDFFISVSITIILFYIIMFMCQSTKMRKRRLNEQLLHPYSVFGVLMYVRATFFCFLFCNLLFYTVVLFVILLLCCMSVRISVHIDRRAGKQKVS